MKENVSVPATTEKSELDFVEIPCTAVSETNIRPLSNELKCYTNVVTVVANKI